MAMEQLEDHLCSCCGYKGQKWFEQFQEGSLSAATLLKLFVHDTETNGEESFNGPVQYVLAFLAKA